MAHSTPGRLGRQVRSLRQQFSRDEGLPFASLLPAADIEPVLREEQVTFRDSLFTPFVTLWVFLSQVFDADPSCQQALARLLAFCLAQGRPACSTDTGGYCKARVRLPVGVPQRLAHAVGRRLHEQADPEWRWHGRNVKVVDGTTVSMPDTPENQTRYPQARTQKPGVGFPIARMVVLFSLAVGSVLAVAIGQYRGKETGETALFRTLHDQLDKDDILLGDRCFCSFFQIAEARRRDADVVLRLHQCRPVDFRSGRCLGPNDQIVTWDKPPCPDWMDEATYAALPDTLEVRITRIHVAVKGFRSQTIDIATSLLDPVEFPAADLGDLFRARWHAELNLRSLKAVLHMDVLRCLSPDMVEKEIGMHLLVYNLIRQVMADAARSAGRPPTAISFKATLQFLNAFREYLTPDQRLAAQRYVALVTALATHIVGLRPDRVEPRAIKRRPKPHDLLTVTRAQARKALLQ